MSRDNLYGLLAVVLGGSLFTVLYDLRAGFAVAAFCGLVWAFETFTPHGRSIVNAAVIVATAGIVVYTALVAPLWWAATITVAACTLAVLAMRNLRRLRAR